MSNEGSRSRQGQFPSPSISYHIAMVESKRSWRKLRNQDVWLALAGLGILYRFKENTCGFSRRMNPTTRKQSTLQ